MVTFAGSLGAELAPELVHLSLRRELGLFRAGLEDHGHLGHHDPALGAVAVHGHGDVGLGGGLGKVNNNTLTLTLNTRYCR